MKKRTSVIFGGILIGLVLCLVGIGIVQGFLQDRENPPVIEEPNWDSPDTRTLAKRACFDCHSNETYWPWYSYVFPLSRLVPRDVELGREVLNFSEWGVAERETENMVETISKGEMPLPYYILLHPEAQLSEAELGRLINGLIETTSQDDHLDAGELDRPEK
jgi:hypothetical protein